MESQRCEGGGCGKHFSAVRARAAFLAVPPSARLAPQLSPPAAPRSRQINPPSPADIM